MKVVHLTSAHSAKDTRIFHKECKYLAAAGYETVLVAPHGCDEVESDVTIRAVTPSGEGRLNRMTDTVYTVYRAALREDADLYHLHDPELIPIGVALRLRGRRVVYDVHEDLPRQIHAKTWIPRYLRRVVATMAEGGEWLVARFFSGVVAATPTIASRFLRDRTALVQNFPIKDEFIIDNLADYPSRPFNSIYVGGISDIRGGREMVKAIGRVASDSDARLVMAGRFKSASSKSIASLDEWEHVDFKGWLGRKSLREELQRARVGLVVLHPTPNYVDSQPIKLFEYMAAGLPVIASDFPAWRKIIREERCGLLVDPLNSKAIADAIDWIFSHPKEAQAMGERGRRAVIEKYNWERESEKLLAFYRQLLA